jgi:hypothetical protein
VIVRDQKIRLARIYGKLQSVNGLATVAAQKWRARPKIQKSIACCEKARARTASF